MRISTYSNKKGLCLAIILASAFLLRLIFLITQNNFHIFDISFFAGDSVLYDGIAKSILAGNGVSYNGEPTAFVTPLYPLFLSFVYLIFGHSLLAVQILQALISSLSVLLVYLIAKKAFNERIGLISAIVMTIYLHQIFWSGYILTETIYVFFVLLSILFFIRFLENQNKLNALIAGISLGVAGLARPIILGFSGFILVYLFFLHKDRIKCLKYALLFILGVLIALSPWIIRNYATFGEFIPGSTESWNVFYQGNSPGATGGIDGYVTGYQDYTPLNFSALCSRQLSEIEMTQMYKLASFTFLRENPASFLKIMPRKFWNMWRPNYANASLKNHILISLPYIVMIALALCGIYYSYIDKKRKIMLILYLFILYHIIFHLVFTGMIRFRLPVEPVLIIFTAYTLNFLLQKKPPLQHIKN